MNKKILLVTGASRGIGHEIANYFQDTYEVISTARTGNVSIQGDLKDKKFLTYLLDAVNPDIFINNAGIISSDFDDIIDINLNANIFLTYNFNKKMTDGFIFNINSQVVNFSGYNLDEKRFLYSFSKKSSKDFHEMLYRGQFSSNKITNIILGSVKTTIENSFHNKTIPETEYKTQTWKKIPMKTTDVCECIENIINNKHYIDIPTLELGNWNKK